MNGHPWRRLRDRHGAHLSLVTSTLEQNHYIHRSSAILRLHRLVFWYFNVDGTSQTALLVFFTFLFRAWVYNATNVGPVLWRWLWTLTDTILCSPELKFPVFAWRQMHWIWPDMLKGIKQISAQRSWTTFKVINLIAVVVNADPSADIKGN